MFERLLYRSILIPSALLGILLLISLMMQVSLSWQNHQRLQPVHAHLLQLDRLQDLGFQVQKQLVESLRSRQRPSAEELGRLRNELEAIDASGGLNGAEIRTQLKQTDAALMDDSGHPRAAMIESLMHLRRVVELATQAHDILLRKADSAAALAFEIATLTLIIVPLLALVTLFLLRRRILCPLRHLGNLMSLLARQEYGPAPIEKADPLLRPLLENYNRMVTRLAELERENEMRRHSLEKQVRAAAQSLLQQQRTLAQAEQLAVVGELSAQIAHNLRNPMAGMEMSLSNLRDEIDNPDHARRIGRVIDELHRMTLSLENLVDRSRHTPEAAKDFGLAETVDDLFELTRYQITESVSLVSEVPADLICRLPEDRLRQSLLNLILNSVEAIGPKPGRVVVSAARRNGQLRLSVCDDGPGFPEATLTKGLQPFVTGREHGTGLGLATAQRFAHDLGGGIELQNRHPRGACVTLRLPCE